ncbi:unnamed protein product [Caenorhabditis bovis]|uniref:Uncharacterized protein n=1 Tax=Caenorhabditis bovis TaxID=2654633 RepID=A0A8S1FBH5_9PELO|nr:unnamed protein product [Caenorhabditis bovis]
MTCEDHYNRLILEIATFNKTVKYIRDRQKDLFGFITISFVCSRIKIQQLRKHLSILHEICQLGACDHEGLNTIIEQYRQTVQLIVTKFETIAEKKIDEIDDDIVYEDIDNEENEIIDMDSFYTNFAEDYFRVKIIKEAISQAEAAKEKEIQEERRRRKEKCIAMHLELYKQIISFRESMANFRLFQLRAFGLISMKLEEGDMQMSTLMRTMSKHYEECIGLSCNHAQLNASVKLEDHELLVEKYFEGSEESKEPQLYAEHISREILEEETSVKADDAHGDSDNEAACEVKPDDLVCRKNQRNCTQLYTVFMNEVPLMKEDMESLGRNLLARYGATSMLYDKSLVKMAQLESSISLICEACLLSKCNHYQFQKLMNEYWDVYDMIADEHSNLMLTRLEREIGMQQTGNNYDDLNKVVCDVDVTDHNEFLVGNEEDEATKESIESDREAVMEVNEEDHPVESVSIVENRHVCSEQFGDIREEIQRCQKDLERLGRLIFTHGILSTVYKREKRRMKRLEKSLTMISHMCNLNKCSHLQFKKLANEFREAFANVQNEYKDLMVANMDEKRGDGASKQTYKDRKSCNEILAKFYEESTMFKQYMNAVEKMLIFEGSTSTVYTQAKKKMVCLEQTIALISEACKMKSCNHKQFNALMKQYRDTFNLVQAEHQMPIGIVDQNDNINPYKENKALEHRQAVVNDEYVEDEQTGNDAIRENSKEKI